MIVQGEVEITCGSKGLIAHSGDIVIINPCELHNMNVLTNEIEYYLIVFEPGMLPDDPIVNAFLSGKLKFNNLVSGNTKVSSLINELIKEVTEKEDGYELSTYGIWTQLFVTLCRKEISQIIDDKTIKSTREYLPRVTPAFSFIAEHFSEHITLNMIASQCGISEKYFCKIFKAATGKTVITYINEYRVSRAEMLLLNTTYEISKIAELVGFYDPLYFSRVFKRIKGISPSFYR